MSLALEQLETPRLLVRRFAPGDFTARHRLTVDNVGHDVPEASTAAWLDWATRNYAMLASLGQPPYGDYAVVLREGGAVVGAVGLVPGMVAWDALTGGNDLRTTPEFGLFWAVLSDYRGRGIATEAGRAMIDFVFARLAARRVVATTEFDNAASQRVMSKLGMTLHRNPGPAPFWQQVVGVLDSHG